MYSSIPTKLKITTTVLGVLSVLTTFLRCYVRIFIIKRFGADDMFVVAAMSTSLWYTVTLLRGIHYGTGKPTADITPEHAERAMWCWWICFIAYATTISLAKISAGLCFLRVFVSPVQRLIVWLTIVASSLIGFSFVFFSIFQCKPVHFFWTRIAGDQMGSCVNIDAIIAYTYAYGAINVATDIALGLSLVALLWDLEMDRRTKMYLAPLMAMACIASYSAIVRMPYVRTFRSADFLFSTVDISLWSTIEIGIAIIACNIAVMRPLARHIRDGISKITSDRRSRPIHSARAMSQTSVLNASIEIESDESRGCSLSR